MQSGIEMPAATFYLSTPRLNSAPIGLSAARTEVESRLVCNRHMVPRRVLVFEFELENAKRVPARFELCGAARWVLPRQPATKEAAEVAGSEENGFEKLVSLNAREGGSFGGITNGFD
jgi:hypothetical protein